MFALKGADDLFLQKQNYITTLIWANRQNSCCIETLAVCRASNGECQKFKFSVAKPRQRQLMRAGIPKCRRDYEGEFRVSLYRVKWAWHLNSIGSFESNLV